MIGVVYLGSNPKTQERLKYIPGQLVRMTDAYKEAAQICTQHVANEHYLVFFERHERNEDITAITYLRKKCRNVYIVL
ncbi:MAG: sugar transferase, partial [Bacteroidaceae bacterium]|nr:sugar transferase [Bacteroidaceae bacterium]